VKYRIKYQFLVLATIILLPLSSYSNSIDPKTECLKKKTQEDSVDVLKEDNKIPEEIKVKATPTKKTIVKPLPEKVAYRSMEDDMDDSGKIGEDDPNSAMSFNFIYYIIDKFKFTDPLE
jgi:hypothetical protein